MIPQFKKAKLILFEPTKFFSKLKEKSLVSAFTYFILLVCIYNVMVLIIQPLTFWLFFDVLYPAFGIEGVVPEIDGLIMVLISVLGISMTIAMSFLVALLLHLWIKLFGGKKKYAETYEIMAYSTTPNYLIGWIPIVGFLTFIYQIYLLILATHQVHKIKYKTTVLMYVIPLSLLFVLYVIGLYFFFTSMV